MNPVVLSDSVSLYRGDCLEIAPALTGIDCVLTDPPYGIGWYQNPRTGIKKDGKTWIKPSRFIGDAARVIGDDKPFDPAPWVNYPKVCLWGANNYASRLPDSPAWIVWDKRDGIPSNSQSDCEMAWTNISSVSIGSSRLVSHKWCGWNKASERGEPRVHPTQKSVSVMAFCLFVMKIPRGAVVLDPYMGSGTTGIACLRTGRKFIGIEIDAKHFATAQERLQREISSIAQGRLNEC